MPAGPLADGLVAFSCSQYVSKPVSRAASPLAEGLVAFTCFQTVSEPVLWLEFLLLMVLWCFPAFRQ